MLKLGQNSSHFVFVSPVLAAALALDIFHPSSLSAPGPWILNAD